MNDMAKNLLLWIVIAIVLIAVFQSFNPRSDPSTVSYSEFMQQIENNNVGEVTIRNDNRTIEAKLKDGNKLHTTALLTDKTVDDIGKHAKVTVEATDMVQAVTRASTPGIGRVMRRRLRAVEVEFAVVHGATDKQGPHGRLHSEKDPIIGLPMLRCGQAAVRR